MLKDIKMPARKGAEAPEMEMEEITMEPELPAEESPLAQFSDEEILTECQVRGLV